MSHQPGPDIHTSTPSKSCLIPEVPIFASHLHPGVDISDPNPRGGGGGGYSLYDGWYICAAVLTPFFDPLAAKLDLFGVFVLIHQHKNDLLGTNPRKIRYFWPQNTIFPSIFLGPIFSGPRHTPSNFRTEYPRLASHCHTGAITHHPGLEIRVSPPSKSWHSCLTSINVSPPSRSQEWHLSPIQVPPHPTQVWRYAPPLHLGSISP